MRRDVVVNGVGGRGVRMYGMRYIRGDRHETVGPAR